MITPRRSRLVRVHDLAAFHSAIADVSCAADIAHARACAVIVPTTAAAAELRTTLENLLLLGEPGGPSTRRGAVVFPDLVTRDGWYRRMHDRLASAPPRLSPFEREVLAAEAVREASEAGLTPPFRLRPGIVTDALDFYDDLLRHRRTLEAFERLLVEELEPASGIDRGAERLLRQTRFLAATFRAYERRRARSGGIDEHMLRELLLESAGRGAYAHVVVTVGDRSADPGGLFAADFDLLTRLPGLESLDVVATEDSLHAGMGERLREMLPGIEEIAWCPDAQPARRPMPGFFTSRDREEELSEVARTLKSARRGAGETAPLGLTAVVFRRPLPYVYLAQAVFAAAGLPFQTADALPLAAEPYAAALDLVFSCVSSGFIRTSITALLACPHLVFDGDGVVVDRAAVSALDQELANAGYLGDPGELVRATAGLTGRPACAARAAASAADELAPLTRPAASSEHLAVLIGFLDRHGRGRAPQDEAWERHERARAAVMGALKGLQAAHVRHGDPVGEFGEVAARIRRWIETQTFSPRRGVGGVHLVDAQAARYGQYDEVFLVGLVEADWPGGSAQNIFYPPLLLNRLGWPAERARLAGTRAAFLDLVSLPRRALTLSAFTLEDDALVERSSLLEEVVDIDARVEPQPRAARLRIFVDEALVGDPVRDDVVSACAKPWIDLRRARSPSSDGRFHGLAGPYVPWVYSVGSVDLYVECPFKFFATHVLKIAEEPEDEEGLSPKARGEFVHDVLRTFYSAWEGGPGGEVTPENLGDARRVFAEVAGRALAGLPAPDEAVERLRLFGSPVAQGVGEIVLGAEAVKPWPVTGRLFEQTLEGLFELAGREGPRQLRLRGKADRIDLVGDRAFRIVDYKTGSAPEWRRSIQLPIYAICASQWLGASRGGRWEVVEAAYLVFAGREPVRVLVPDAKGTDRALATGQQRFLDAIDGMARGEFPPRPAETRLCRYCRFAAVCRKEWVVDE